MVASTMEEGWIWSSTGLLVTHCVTLSKYPPLSKTFIIWVFIVPLLLVTALIKLVVTTVPGPRNDAQHPPEGIYVRGDTGEAELISGSGCRGG